MNTFFCPSCSRGVPWSEGAGDAWPDLCDRCAVAAMRVATPLAGLHRRLDASRWPTWLWERLALLALELPIYAAGVVLLSTWAGWLAASASLAGALIAQAQRSISARRAEEAARRGEGGHALRCEQAAARWATAGAVFAAAAPGIVLATAALGPGVRGATIYGAAVVALRWAWGAAYRRWRASRAAWRVGAP